MSPAALNCRLAPRRGALTLMELVVVMVILVALAGLLLPLFGSVAFQSVTNASMENLRRLQEMIVNRYAADMKGAYLSGGTSPPSGSPPGANPDGLPRLSANASPPQLKYLYVDPNSGTSSAGYNASTGLGWNGPYVLTGQGMYPGLNSGATARGFVSGGALGINNDSTPLDAWGNPIVIVPIHDQTRGQLYYVLLSAGSTGSLGKAVANYGALQSPYISTQYYLDASGNVTTTSPTTYTGASIWAVAAPLDATVNAAGTNGTESLDNTSYGPTLTTTSDNAIYKYWLPLK